MLNRRLKLQKEAALRLVEGKGVKTASSHDETSNFEDTEMTSCVEEDHENIRDICAGSSAIYREP